MDIVFQCSQSGRKLYAVREYGSDLFVGSREECGRFLTIHNRKVLEERADALRVPRHPRVGRRIYRAPSRMGA